MEISMTTFLIVCPMVFLAGLMDAIAGGGGLISLPAFMIAGVPMHLALGTNKLASSLGTLVATIRLLRNNYMDIGLGMIAVVFALAGSAAGSSLVLFVDERVVAYMMLFILPVTAFYVLKNKKLGEGAEVEPISRKKAFILSSVISLIIGGYDGFYGPGTGTFLILAFTGLVKLDIKKAAGNTKMVNLASNVGAVAVFMLNGKINFALGLTAAVFSIAGNYIGAGLVMTKGLQIVRPVVIVVLSILFIKIIVG